MKAWWQHYTAAFTPEECAAIKVFAMTLPKTEGRVGHGGQNRTDKMRRSTVRWMPQEDMRLRWVYDRLALRALEVNANAFHLDFGGHAIPRHGAAQFTEYRAAKQGHYDWHEDNCWISSERRHWDRKLSCVVQLTDPEKYEGGRLELDIRDPAHALPPEKFRNVGDMIYFPSHLRHRVAPVTRGVRHSLVLWFEGPPLS